MNAYKNIEPILEVYPAAKLDNITNLERTIGYKITTEYKLFLLNNNGLSANTVQFYDIDTIIHDYKFYEIENIEKGIIIIASDGGGIGALMRTSLNDKAIYLTHMSDIYPKDFKKIEENLDAWLNIGCPFE